MAGAVPLLLAYLRGHNGSTKMGEAGNAVFDTLTQTIPGTAVSLLALIALAWCVRRLSFEAMAYRPGRIEVPAFGSGPGIEANAEQLTTVFRQRLAVLSLSAPTPVPGAGGDGDFLDVLGREKLDPTNLAGSLVGLMRAAKPNHTWQVTGLLVQRELAPRYGVTLQVAQLPRGANPAAHDLGGQLRARRAPRRRSRDGGDPPAHAPVPRAVVGVEAAAAARRAAVRARERGGAGGRAPLRRGPRRLLPRVRAGSDEHGAAPEDRPAAREGRALSRRADDLRGDHQGLQAGAEVAARASIRSRRARSGGAPCSPRATAGSFCSAAPSSRGSGAGPGRPNGGRWSARDERRRELRSRLRRPLHEQLVEVAERHEGATLLADPGQVQLVDALRRCGTMAPKDLLAEPSPTRDDATEYQLRELLALLALDELAAMPFLRLRFLYRKLQLTPEAVRLTQMCIKVRLAWLQAQLAPRDQGVLLAAAARAPRGPDPQARGSLQLRPLARALQRRLRLRAAADGGAQRESTRSRSG